MKTFKTDAKLENSWEEVFSLAIFLIDKKWKAYFKVQVSSRQRPTEDWGSLSNILCVKV